MEEKKCNCNEPWNSDYWCCPPKCPVHDKTIESPKQSEIGWVKASDRLPGYETPVKWRDGNDHIHTTERKIPLIHMAKPFLTGWEWYDESGAAAAGKKEWDSVRLIGRVKERFKELEEKQHDWRSFYCAWLEGRVDMLQQIKGYGRLSQEQADLIREANDRDMEGVAGREEDALSKEVIDFIRDIAENWDCDEDGHKYNTGCRKCSASELYYELSKQQKEK